MSEQLSGRKRKCDVCGKPFLTILEWEERHDFHEPDCQNYHASAIDVPCECDLLAHRTCCPGENCYRKSKWAKENGY